MLRVLLSAAVVATGILASGAAFACEGGKLLIDTPIKAKLVWQGKQQEIEPGKHNI